MSAIAIVLARPAKMPWRALGIALGLLALAGCSSQSARQAPEPTPAQVRATLAQLLPAKVSDRSG